MKNDNLEKMQSSLVKHFLDVIVMAMMKRLGSLSGYDIIKQVNQNLDIFVSPGTVYALLYSLERKGLARGECTDGKRVYSLTENGEATIDEILRSKEELFSFMRTLFEKQLII